LVPGGCIPVFLTLRKLLKLDTALHLVPFPYREQQKYNFYRIRIKQRTWTVKMLYADLPPCTNSYYFRIQNSWIQMTKRTLQIEVCTILVCTVNQLVPCSSKYFLILKILDTA